MKPISLVIDGINSFYDRQVVDFDFDGLFCISGDTGSGKTTILDCIIIALYGSGKRATVLSDYINLKRNKAEIKLTFEAVHEGERKTFEVTRVLTRDGASRAKLTDLTCGKTLAEQTSSVNELLKDMIGLTREDFTQVVILEQGKFAKFLTATKKERNETVGNLFKLNKYRELGSKFGSRMKELKKDIDNLDERLSELKGVTLTALQELERDIRSKEKSIDSLIGSEGILMKEISELEEQKRKYEKSNEAKVKLAVEEKNYEQAKAKLAELIEKCDLYAEKLKKAMEDKTECELKAARAGDFLSLISERDKRSETLEKLRIEWKEAVGKEADCKEELSKAREKEKAASNDLSQKMQEIFSLANLSDRSDVFEIKSEVDKLSLELKSAKADRAELEKKVKELEERYKNNTNNLSQIMEKMTESAQKRDDLRKEAEELRHRLDHQRQVEAAAFVRKGLKKGDTCPVCGNAVENEYAFDEYEDLSLPLAQKEEQLQTAEKEYNMLDNNMYSFNTRLEESAKALSEAKGRLNETEERLAKLCETIFEPDKIDNLLQTAAKSVELKRQLDFLNSEANLLDHKLKAACDKTTDIKKRGEAERIELDRLIGVINERQISEEQLKQNDLKLKELEMQVKELTDKDDFYKAERERLAATVASLTASLNLLKTMIVDIPEFDMKILEQKTDLLKNAKEEREELIFTLASRKKELEIMQNDLEKKRALEKEKGSRKKRYDVISDIYKIVAGDKFIEYIAEEYILQFTASASIVLGDITSGKYTLEYESGDFYVRDFLSDGTVRKASTLSGGETFLASLALAIAISREIARYKTYEFFFLDEGFGTLDAYSLDTVMNALNSLSADTLVGVVTHRPELTERIFDKITVLSASSERGSVITRSY